MPSAYNRVLLFASNCYLDDSNGAAVASRAMMEGLSRRGFAVEALTGSMVELGGATLGEAWLAGRGLERPIAGGTWTADGRGVRGEAPPHERMVIRGVPVTIHRGGSARGHEAVGSEREEFLTLFEAVARRFRPDVLVTFGDDGVSREVRARARARGIAVVFALHNFSYIYRETFATVDAAIVPSRFAADYYRRTTGLECSVLPNLVAFDRVQAEVVHPRYVTFVNPSYEKGVYFFARVADLLGLARPDIPLLVVEGRGSERTLADCGLDLTLRGNVSLMSHTPDPRQFWGVTRICLLPSLWWENQPLVAVEAMVNGIPVIGSNRGGIPEALGKSGIILPIPERLNPTTRELPEMIEALPWVEAITGLWADSVEYARQRGQARAESRRWAPEVLEPLYEQFFNEVCSGSSLS